MPANDEVINLEELKEIMSGDMGFAKECFQDFLNEWPAPYVDIQKAVMKENADQLEESAHKLKGTLKYLAAEKAANAAYALESAGKQGDISGIEDKLKHLETECEKLVRYIHDFKP